MRVSNQDGHGRGLHRSSQADPSKRHSCDGSISSGGNRRWPRHRANVGVHKRTLRSARRVSSQSGQDGHGRGLRRSSQADQSTRYLIDGGFSSGYNRFRLLERKGGKLRKEAALRKGAALSNSQFRVPGRTIHSARGLKSLDADGVRWRRDSRVGQKPGYGLDGQKRSSRRPRLGKERAAAVAGFLSISVTIL